MRRCGGQPAVQDTILSPTRDFLDPMHFMFSDELLLCSLFSSLAADRIMEVRIYVHCTNDHS